MASRNWAVDRCCQICGLQGGGFYFGCYSCRACSAFFRRSITDKRIYKCTQEGKCKMRKAMRYSCKSCRLDLCLTNGMKPEAIRPTRKSPEKSKQVKLKTDETSNLESQLPELNNLSLQTKIPAIISITQKDPNNCLEQICNGYKTYHDQQRSLFMMLYPNENPYEFRVVSRDEHIKMERGCMNLVFNMLNDYFHPFGTLFDVQTKVINMKILRSFAAHFSMLDQSFRTSVEFPDPNDSRYIFHTGQYLDYQRMDEFFNLEKDLKSTLRQCDDLRKRLKVLINRMREMKPRHIETAALVGILLWNEVAVVDSTQTKVTEERKEQIFKDLHLDLSLKYGEMAVSRRMGDLLSLLQNLEQVVKLTLEIVMIGKVFSNNSQVFEE